jgi:hypothetical protein
MVVVQEDGSPCLKGAVLRSMGDLLDAFFFGLVGYSAMQTSQEQRHGDE